MASRAQRPLVDEVAQAQVMARQPGDVRPQPLAGAQPGEDLAGQLGALVGVAGEPVAALRQRTCVAGLADVVQQRAQAQRAAAVELVAQRLAQQRRDRAGVAPRRATAAGSASSAIDLLEHLERVAVDVAVVVARLLDPAHRVELGQHGRGRAQVVEPAQPVERRAAPPRSACSSAKTRSWRDAGQQRGARARAAATVAGSGSSPARRRSARRAATRSGSSSNASRPPRAAGRRRGRRAPPCGSTSVAARQRLGHRVDGEVALREVLLDRRAAQRREVGLPGAVGREHAPAAERVGERERRAAGGAGQARAGGRASPRRRGRGR